MIWDDFSRMEREQGMRRDACENGILLTVIQYIGYVDVLYSWFTPVLQYVR